MSAKSTTSKIALTMFCAGALSFGMAPAAMAADGITGTPTAGAAQTGTGNGPTGNTAAIYQGADWATAVDDVVKNLHFTADEHKGGATALHIMNGSDHEVTIDVRGEHGHRSNSPSFEGPVTVQAGSPKDVSAGGGTKQWVTATLTHIDGTPLPEPLVLLKNGHAVTITVDMREQFIEENVPEPEPQVVTSEAPEVVETGQREEIPEGTRESHTGVGQLNVPLLDTTDDIVRTPEPGRAPVAPVPVEQKTPELKPTVTQVVPAPAVVAVGQREDLQPGGQGSFIGGAEVTEHVVGSYGPVVAGGQREDLQPGSQASNVGGQGMILSPNAAGEVEGTSTVPVEPAQAKPVLAPTGGQSAVPQPVLPPQQEPSKVVEGHGTPTVLDLTAADYGPVLVSGSRPEVVGETHEVLTGQSTTVPATALTPATVSVPAAALTPATISVPATALTPATTSIPVEVPATATTLARPESVKPSRSKARTEVKTVEANDTADQLAHTGAEETAALAALALALMGTGITLVGLKRRRTA